MPYGSPGTAPIHEATFHVMFIGARRPRSVTIRPPTQAFYTRDQDSEIVAAC